MMLEIFNVMERRKQIFRPITENEVKMYACGVTVSGDAHIGHARQALVYDVFRRYLEYLGYFVRYVRNYTDVDDKIIEKAKALNMKAKEYADEQLRRIDKDLTDLGIQRANKEPRVTEYIQEIIEFIKVLIKKGYAYISKNGDVYFAVEKSVNYGRLSNRKIDDSISETRIKTAEGKRDERDFALWKIEDGDFAWDSPWGRGRPGWHIECSAMCLHCLGEVIDIHGGGQDLIFPHHENEIAQSNAFVGKEFVNYWTHCGLVLVNGQKMGKSLNNTILVRDLLDNYAPEIIRYLLMQYSYRSEIDFTDGIFDKAEKSLYKFYQILHEVDNLAQQASGVGFETSLHVDIRADFKSAMDDDFNMALAISNLFEYFKLMTDLAKNPQNATLLIKIKEEVVEVYSVLNLLQDDPRSFLKALHDKYFRLTCITETEVEEMISQRQTFKENKDYVNADRIRNELSARGISLLDSKTQQTKWEFSALL